MIKIILRDKRFVFSPNYISPELLNFIFISLVELINEIVKLLWRSWSGEVKQEEYYDTVLELNKQEKKGTKSTKKIKKTHEEYKTSVSSSLECVGQPGGGVSAEEGGMRRRQETRTHSWSPSPWSPQETVRFPGSKQNFFPESSPTLL